MGDMVKIRVYNREGQDVTDTNEWYINKDGDLMCDDEYEDTVRHAGSEFFYELEITPMGANGRRLKVSEDK